MISPDEGWGAYARLQNELDQRQDVDDHAWGLENALNLLLDPIGIAVDPDRAVRSGARKARHRARLLRIEFHQLLDRSDAELAASLDRRDALDVIRGQVSELDWRFVRMRAAGHSYAAVARAIGVSSGALRVRFARLRRTLRQGKGPRRLR